MMTEMRCDIIGIETLVTNSGVGVAVRRMGWK